MTNREYFKVGHKYIYIGNSIDYFTNNKSYKIIHQNNHTLFIEVNPNSVGRYTFIKGRTDINALGEGFNVGSKLLYELFIPQNIKNSKPDWL